MAKSYNMSTKQNTLGVTIQSDLKWHSRVTIITKQANSTLGFLRRNLKSNSTSVKEQAYKYLVRPSLEYACSVWNPYFAEDINLIEFVKRRAARYITGRQNDTSSVNDMIDKLHWRNLADRRVDARLTMLYKIEHEKVAISKTNRLIPLTDSHEICTLSHSKFPLVEIS